MNLDEIELGRRVTQRWDTPPDDYCVAIWMLTLDGMSSGAATDAVAGRHDPVDFAEQLIHVREVWRTWRQ